MQIILVPPHLKPVSNALVSLGTTRSHCDVYTEVQLASFMISSLMSSPGTLYLHLVQVAVRNDPEYVEERREKYTKEYIGIQKAENSSYEE